jgi:catechol 2,3-dioxygenase-like lactoylglutathione lyase family enzyme
MAIFTHVCVGTNDLDKANKFYTAALGALSINNLGAFGLPISSSIQGET